MGNKNILVVDDDRHIRNACAESLKGDKSTESL